MNAIFRSFHWNRDFPRYVRILHPHMYRVGTYGLPRRRYKNDLESEYPFPRIVAMKGDGKTSYDVGKDGVPTMIGECAVRADVSKVSSRFPTKCTGRLSPQEHSDKAQGHLCQGHGIGRTSTRTFLIQPLTFQFASR